MSKIFLIVVMIGSSLFSSDKILSERNSVQLSIDQNALLNEYKTKKDSLPEIKNYISNQLFSNLSSYLTISFENPKLDTEKIEIPYKVSLAQHKLCVLFKKFNDDVQKFSESEAQPFHELIVESAYKNRVFFSILGEYMSSEIPMGISLDGDSKNCLRIERSIGWTPLYPYGVKDTIVLQASESIINKLSEFKAEIIYLKFPNSWLPDVEFDGKPNNSSEIISTKNQGPTISGKKIVLIDSIPITNDVDYFKVIKNIKQGTVVDIGIQDGHNISFFKKIVHDAIKHDERTQDNDSEKIKDLIASNFRYPKEAIRKKIEGDVIVSFVLLESGEVTELTVEKSSDYEILDRAALDVVRESVASFPKLRQKRKITIPFEYSLR